MVPGIKGQLVTITRVGKNKKHTPLFKTEEEKADPHLKKYLDLYRSDYALKHKLAGDMDKYRFYLNRLDLPNISKKTALLLKLPIWLLRMLFSVKQKLKSKGVFIDIYN